MWVGWVQDGVPDHREEETAVQVHVWVGFHLNGFHSSPLPETCSSSLDFGAFPVDTVVGILDMDCDAILGVSSSYCLPMFTQPDFQCPLGFSHIHTSEHSLWEPCTPLLSAPVLGSLSSPASICFSSPHWFEGRLHS